MSLSGLDSDDRDLINSPASRQFDQQEDSDDEAAWDEVDVNVAAGAGIVPAPALAVEEGAGATKQPGEIEIVISTGKKGKRKGPKTTTTRDRMIRQERHKTHTICHLATGLIRNRYVNDKLLQARLLSKIPLRLTSSFSSITRQAYPSELDRVRMFDQSLDQLLSWWWQNFEMENGKGIKRRTVEAVETELNEGGWRIDASTSEVPDLYTATSDPSLESSKKKRKGKEKVRAASEDDFEGDDPVHSSKSLMKRALLMKGSRDMSTQLFTALCRALDIPARLVFSFQPIDWRAPSTLKTTGTGSGNASSTSARGAARGKKKIVKNGKIKKVDQEDGFTTASSYKSERDDSDGSWADGRGKLNYTIPAINLRHSKMSKRASPAPDAYDKSRPPVFWTEVWSRPKKEWITVDPVRKMMRCHHKMEPSKSNTENQMMYVVAFEEDQSVRDVTPRYAKSFTIQTLKARVPSKKGTDWFAELIKPHERAFQLNRDREEHEALWKQKALPFPTSVGAFKNHPSYVLEQHLRREEVIRPDSKTLTHFRGEPVFARSAVVALKSLENYWREGRSIKDGEIPMKWVKQRTVTINKKRAEAYLQMDGEEPLQQGLYSMSQTELYKPPPIKDGKVPKNNFGNIDLFVPTMLPDGALHIPGKTAAKVAKTMEIDYAEAIIGFEFHKRRAVPTMSGIVVSMEFADVLLEAIENSEEAAQEKEFAKRQERVLKRWKKLIVGLRIRQRLQASYHTKETAAPADQASQLSKPVKRKKRDITSSSDSDSAAPVKVSLRPKAKATSTLPEKKAKASTSATHVKPLPAPAPASRPQRAVASKATTPTTSSSLRRPTRSSSRIAPTAEVEPAQRSSTGRTLRFTMSTEQAQAEKQGSRRAAVGLEESGAPVNMTLSDTEDEDESELELESDF